jgi:hypothetical protein
MTTSDQYGVSRSDNHAMMTNKAKKNAYKSQHRGKTQKAMSAKEHDKMVASEKSKLKKGECKHIGHDPDKCWTDFPHLRPPHAERKKNFAKSKGEKKVGPKNEPFQQNRLFSEIILSEEDQDEISHESPIHQAYMMTDNKRNLQTAIFGESTDDSSIDSYDSVEQAITTSESSTDSNDHAKKYNIIETFKLIGTEHVINQSSYMSREYFMRYYSAAMYHLRTLKQPEWIFDERDVDQKSVGTWSPSMQSIRHAVKNIHEMILRPSMDTSRTSQSVSTFLLIPLMIKFTRYEYLRTICKMTQKIFPSQINQIEQNWLIFVTVSVMIKHIFATF